MHGHGWNNTASPTKAIMVPHEPVAAGPWALAPPPLKGRKLRVAVLGVLAEQKGAQTVIAVAEAADLATLELHLIGHAENGLPETIRDRIVVSGAYSDAELPGLLARVKPHVVWFAAQWPETYSYTLSAAVDAGLPVVASRIGAFVERLQGRPLSWLVDPRASPEAWLRCFDEVRAALATPQPPALTSRPAVGDFYATSYLPARREAAMLATRGRTASGLVDLRRSGSTSIVLVPEQLDNGEFSPCAYIRLLQPLDHPAIGRSFDIVLADAEEALRYAADIVATQRYAVPDLAAADRLRRIAAAWGRRWPTTSTMTCCASRVTMPTRRCCGPRRRWCSGCCATPARCSSLPRRWRQAWHPCAATHWWCRTHWMSALGNVPERGPPGRRALGGPVRLLCMGTATHGADFAMIEPALARLRETYGDRVTIDVLGVSTRADLPEWVNRPTMPPGATATYPGFVNWITQQEGWDIGLAPLADTTFNRCKSAIKTLDYAALGLAVVASDVAAYRGSLADGPGGMLVANRPEAWYRGAEQAGAGCRAAAWAGAGGNDGIRHERHARTAGGGAPCRMAGGGAADGRRRAGRLNARMDVSNVWMCQT